MRLLLLRRNCPTRFRIVIDRSGQRPAILFKAYFLRFQTDASLGRSVQHFKRVDDKVRVFAV